MSKTIIEVKCYDQVLTFVNTPVVASGGVGEDFVSAEFCEKWDSFAVSMLFWRQGVDPIPVLADTEGLYQVPPELMTTDGVVYFGAVGIDPNGVRRTSEGVSYRIQAGAIAENTTLPEPDGDVFEQLLSQYADVKVYVSSYIQGAAEGAEAARKAAESAASSAAAAVSAAADAKSTAAGAVSAAADAKSTATGAVSAAGDAQSTAEGAVSAAGDAAAAAKTAKDVAESRARQFWGTYVGDGTTKRIVLFNLESGPSICVVMRKHTNGFATDFMVIFGHANWGGFSPYGFCFTGLGTANPQYGLATGIAYNGGIRLDMDGVGGPDGFNEKGASYYVWGLVDQD